MESNQPLQNKTKAVRRQKIFRNIIMILLCLISLIPFYLMFVNATRTSTQVQSGISLLFGSNLKNNIANFDKSQQGLGVTVLQSMFNSFKVAVPFTVLSVYFSSMTAYGIHNYSFKGRKAAWAFIMAVMMVPSQISIIGFYRFMLDLKLIDTYVPLIIPTIAAPTVVFFMKQYMEGALSKELVEAARIDGLSEFGIFWKIMLPQVKPAVITLVILSVNGSWNDLLWPMIVTSSTEMRTLANGLALFIGQNTIEYGAAFAGALVSLLPMFVLYMFGQKYFVEGMSSGGLKG